MIYEYNNKNGAVMVYIHASRNCQIPAAGLQAYVDIFYWTGTLYSNWATTVFREFMEFIVKAKPPEANAKNSTLWDRTLPKDPLSWT